MADIIDYYANKFGTTRTNLNPKEIKVLNELSEKYSYEDLAKAISKLNYRPNPNNLIKELLKLLEEIKHEKKKSEEKPAEKTEEQKPRRYTFDDIPNNYKELFAKYNIPADIIDFDTLSTLNKTMRSFYLSDLIAEHLYNNLPQEKLAEYTEKADKHFSKMKLTEKEKPEAYKIYIKSLIKKELGIYV